MKKVTLRGYATILIALAILLGLVIYIARYISDGEDWALYYAASTSNSTYTLTDRNSKTLAKMSADGKTYSDDSAIRTACYHLLGDYTGNVGTGVLQNFSREIADFDLINGIKDGEDKTLTLTVDSELNRVANEALAGRKGAVLVANYKTGELLCMVSGPTIDPSDPPETIPDGAYINRALSSCFAPGSVFKLVTLTAAIENMDDIYSRRFTCSGSIEVMGNKVTCTGVHGEQTIEQALANSCNCAFGSIALELGADVIGDTADKLGLTSTHKLNDITTAAGAYDRDESGSASLAWSGIGQYNDLVCPYSMLRLVSAIANGGVVCEPSLLGASADKETLMSSTTADKIASMMSYNVTYKYGRDTFPGLDIAAKTGTAEVDGQESHGWFVGFLNDPEHPYAFTVIIENGGSGLSSAGRVARTVLNYAVNN